jgi:hypothetical protein
MPLEELHEEFDRPDSHFVVREGNGRQTGKEVRGDEFLVIEADYRKIIGDPEVEFRRCAIRPHRHAVVVAKERCRTIASIKHPSRRLVTGERLGRRRGNQRRVERYAVLFEHSSIAFEPTMGRGHVIVVIEERDPSVPSLDEVGDRGDRAPTSSGTTEGTSPARSVESINAAATPRRFGGSEIVRWYMVA